MSRVYFDPGVILARPDAEEIDESAIASDAAEQLRTLADTGHEVVVMTDRPLALPEDFPAVVAMPRPDSARDAWLLTTDPEHCGRRYPGVRSILVGPGPGTRKAAIHRCDIQARDLKSAVIEILAREAMTVVG